LQREFAPIIFEALLRSFETLRVPRPFLSPSGKCCPWPARFLFGFLLFVYSLPAGSYAWKSGDGYRYAELPAHGSNNAGFSLMPVSVTGVTFTNHLSDKGASENQIRLNGSGVALGDVDGDGWCDIYFCRLEGGNVLYRNLGDWRFEDVTAAAGVACPGQYSTGACFADIDGDGDLDLLVNAIGGGTRLFLNDGKGRFTENTKAGLVSRFGAMSMALADIDGDGDLDLYVANYRTTTIRSTGLDVMVVNGKRLLRPEDRDNYEVTPEGYLLEHGEADVVYRNDGKGNFSQVSWTDGTFFDDTGKPLAVPPRDWGNSVMFRDLNGDNAPDIYVCNDFWTPDRIWINDGNGRFRAAPPKGFLATSSFSMGVDFADINRDGLDDLIVLDMLSRDHVKRMSQASLIGAKPRSVGNAGDRQEMERNTLLLNRGDGTFAEIAQLSGVDATEWSWCPIFLDVDLDGYEDLLISNGYSFDVQDKDAEDRINASGPWTRERVGQKVLMYPTLHTANLAFRNRGDLTFAEMGAAWGFNLAGVSQGMALADLDNDGDLDVVINNMNMNASLYRNDTTAPRLAVRLKGESPNTRGTGARLKVFGGPVPQTQEMICGGRYLSSDDSMRVFAAGTSTNRLRIEVVWRNGKRGVIENAKPDRIYELDERAAVSSQHPVSSSTAKTPMFEDVSQLIAHSHHEEVFDDFARQPLLPNRLSQLGPGVAWFDLDNDGWDDVVIGSGRGGRLSVYRNDGQGGFQKLSAGGLTAAVTRDQTTVLGWRKPRGQVVVLAGSSNYEDGMTVGASVRQYELAENLIDDSMPGAVSSTGPLALADVDGDGELDLFVGGRCVPGKYPEPASSRLFLSKDGKLGLDEASSRALANIGLISGAVFSDLDGDGAPELILACEWGPVRVLHNEKGRFTEITKEMGLDQYLGWWNGVTTGDFDEDGRMDIVASNWGRNTQYERFRSQPLSLYYGDLDENGSIDVIEACYDEATRKLVPIRNKEDMGRGLPFVLERFRTHKAYGEASLPDVFGERLRRAKKVSSNRLETTIFLNRGNRFEPVPLPIEAQFAPAFAVCVGDCDGDGHEDIFLSQNFFATNPQSSPLNSGCGLWLRGDGKGGFSALSSRDSGIKVYGEQRGAALCDYDADGRVDLIVTQNGAPTRLFRNTSAKPGMRVRLEGPRGNPTGVGGVVRLRFGNRFGPAREIHAGSGYWSQDSAVAVLGLSGTPTELEIHWPGGKTTMTPLSKDAREVTINLQGQIQTKGK